MHLPAQHVHNTERESRFSGIDAFEIDQARKHFLERVDRIEAGPLDADLRLKAPDGRHVRRIKAGYPCHSGGEARRHACDPR